MPSRCPFNIPVVFSLALLCGYSAARADEVLYRYDCDILPSDPAAGWPLFNPCEPPCSESLDNGHFVLLWTQAADIVHYHHSIAESGETAPPTLWVEWRFRSNHPLGANFSTCDGFFVVHYCSTDELINIYGDAAITGAPDFITGLELDAFHTYRYENVDGSNFTVAVDGEVFIDKAQDFTCDRAWLDFGGFGGCLGDQFPNMINRWDHIRYGTISFGEQIIAADPPAGLLDATPNAALNRFTVTFDSPNYVYLDEITVEVTGGTAPTVTATRRLDNGEPEVVEIVLDGPMPLNETTRFTFDDGTAVNVVEYTLVPIGACCFPGGSCEERIDTDCTLEGGQFLDGPCEGDADADGIDGRCGDPCPNDNPDDTDGDGVCDTNDPCPIDNPDDTDADGICDSADACPGFDDNLDTDGDTVPDCQDQCPGADDAIYAPHCTVAIPTTTAWGLIVLGLLLLILAKVAWDRRTRSSGQVP